MEKGQRRALYDAYLRCQINISGQSNTYEQDGRRGGVQQKCNWKQVDRLVSTLKMARKAHCTDRSSAGKIDAYSSQVRKIPPTTNTCPSGAVVPNSLAARDPTISASASSTASDPSGNQAVCEIDQRNARRYGSEQQIAPARSVAEVGVTICYGERHQ